MQTLYSYNDLGYLLAEVMEVPDHEGIEPGWTSETPPVAPEGFVAKWAGVAWTLESEADRFLKTLNRRKETLRAALHAQYDIRLSQDVQFDFASATSITDASGQTPPSTLLAMQMTKQDQDNWRTKWTEALSSASTDLLVIICENRWYVAATPPVLIQAFKHVTQIKQMLLAGMKALERLIEIADTEAALDNVETAIANPVWGIA